MFEGKFKTWFKNQNFYINVDRELGTSWHDTVDWWLLVCEFRDVGQLGHSGIFTRKFYLNSTTTFNSKVGGIYEQEW